MRRGDNEKSTIPRSKATQRAEQLKKSWATFGCIRECIVMASVLCTEQKRLFQQFVKCTQCKMFRYKLLCFAITLVHTSYVHAYMHTRGSTRKWGPVYNPYGEDQFTILTVRTSLQRDHWSFSSKNIICCQRDHWSFSSKYIICCQRDHWSFSSKCWTLCMTMRNLSDLWIQDLIYRQFKKKWYRRNHCIQIDSFTNSHRSLQVTRGCRRACDGAYDVNG